MSVAVVHKPSKAGHVALAAAFAEAALRGTDVVILHSLSGAAAGAAAKTELAAVSTTVAEMVGDSPATAWSLVVESPDPDSVSAYLTLLERSGADLLVVGSKQRTAVGKLLMGQATQRLLLECPVPVLLVKPADA